MTEKLFRIVDRPKVGRCLLATREISPLEIILTDEPAVIGPQHDSLAVCVQCLRVHEDDFYCSNCSQPLCDEECRDEPEHTQECPLLEKLSKSLQNRSHVMQLLMIMRLYLLQQRDPDLWLEIACLMDHQEERRQCEEEWTLAQTTLVDPLKPVLNTQDDELIHRLIGIISVNAVGFDYKKQMVTGRALYPTLSLTSHNCVANARYTVNYDDLSITLRSRRTIAEGEEITVNYVPPVYGQPKRRRHLQDEWYFECSCLRCLDCTEFGTYVSALKCSHCSEGLILAETPAKDSLWRCRFCRNPFDADFIFNFVQDIEDELYAILKDNLTIKSVEGFMKEHCNDLHTKHYLNLIAQRNLIQLLCQEPKTNREVQRKIFRLSKNFISTMTRLDPGYSDWMGKMVKMMNEAQLAILKLDLQERKIDKNQFAEKSEVIWKSMQEVEKCGILCTPASIY